MSARLDELHRTAAPDMLRALANLFSQPGGELDVGVRSSHDKRLAACAKTGAVERLHQRVWKVTLAATLHAQFLIARVLDQGAPAKGGALH